MPKSSSKATEANRLAASKTTMEALTELAGNLHEMVLRNSLDPRFARKLVKRILEEAECVAWSTDEQSSTYQSAMERLQTSIKKSQATEFVAAAAALRDLDASRAST
ncbi:hypothetical protein SAMN02787142_8059 [Burkholderia sp. WP9]|uniref:hypothetical protein n=1 Tax=Burkholderia sp. WP9 TaxID=1500263 RepID=UPI0008980DE3|nr:hypothetical protein [Burkholderia sp. WP9]SEF13416.1 hypothetical protein SAMN02787142_8059 [Burkholderia sp. WP9]